MIDKNKTKGLLDELDALFDSVAGGLSPETRKWLREKLIGPALGEIEEMVRSARPPVFYLIGRSGHGKSSLVNALAGRHLAEVSHVKPGTLHSETYSIPFEDVFATWRVIDSRGIFETTSPDGGPAEDVVDFLKRDLIEKKPDVILHVITATEVRALANDLVAYKEISRTLKDSLGTIPPTIIVMTKVDILDNPRDWPPGPWKLGLIDDALRFMCSVLALNPLPIDLNAPYKGCVLPGYRT